MRERENKRSHDGGRECIRGKWQVAEKTVRNAPRSDACEVSKEESTGQGGESTMTDRRGKAVLQPLYRYLRGPGVQCSEA